MSKKTNAYTVLFRALCFGAAAACSVLIFRDLPSGVVEASLGSGPRSIAEAAWTHGEASLKRAEYERSVPLLSGQFIEDGALVKTGQGSGALIRLPGARGSVSLGESSEAKFSAREITLIAGTLGFLHPSAMAEGGSRAQPRDPPSLKTGEFTVQPDSAGEVSLHGPQQGRFRLRVLSGNASLYSTSGSAVIRGGEDAVYREKAGETARVGRMSFALLSPRDGAAVLPKSGRVTFRMNVDVNASEGRSLELVISNSPTFSSVQQTYVVPASEPPLEYVEIKTPVPPSRSPWYWKVRARGDPQFSYPERFWNLPRGWPLLRFPLPAATAPAGLPVELVWDPVDNASGYEVEAEGSATRTSEHWTSLPGLPKGPAHWRVRAFLANGETTPWSPSRAIEFQ